MVKSYEIVGLENELPNHVFEKVLSIANLIDDYYSDLKVNLELPGLYIEAEGGGYKNKIIYFLIKYQNTELETIQENFVFKQPV